jgi:hypothetical protein
MNSFRLKITIPFILIHTHILYPSFILPFVLVFFYVPEIPSLWTYQVSIKMHFQDWNVKTNLLCSVLLNSFKSVVWNSLLAFSWLQKSKLIVLKYFFSQKYWAWKVLFYNNTYVFFFFSWYIYELLYNHLICVLFVILCIDFFLNHEASNSPPFFCSGPCVSYLLRKRALYNDMSR